jgi:hypothetical protein
MGSDGSERLKGRGGNPCARSPEIRESPLE